MPLKRNILVVANQTVGSEELRRELRDRCAQGPTTVTVLLPHRRTELAEQRLRRAVAELREDGLEVDGKVANPDPFLAVHEAWHPAKYDEILISTLPTASSRWLKADLPSRIERHTGALVAVVSGRPRAADAIEEVTAAVRPTVTASLSQDRNVITLALTTEPRFTEADVEAVLAALADRGRAA
jgi:hypothetical protein